MWGIPECTSWKTNNDQSARTHNLVLQSLFCVTDPRPNMNPLIVEFRNNWNWLISCIGNCPEERKRNERFLLEPSDVWAWDASFSRSSGSLLGHLVGSALYQGNATAGNSRDDEQQTEWRWRGSFDLLVHVCLVIFVQWQINFNSK